MSIAAIKSTPPAQLAAAASVKAKKKVLPTKVSTTAKNAQPTSIKQTTSIKQSTPAASTRIDVKA